MKNRKNWGLIAAGAAAGAVNGLFGAGGGMLLVPLLTLLTQLRDEEIFPTSVSIILPICVVSLLFRFSSIIPAFHAGLPYLLGSIPGGLLAAWLSGRIPVKWLHRSLGLLVIWGGVRYLC